MKSLSLILRILAIVAAVAAAGLYFATQGKLTEKQAELDKAQTTTQAVQAELETSANQVASLESRLSGERAALGEAKQKLETMRSEMYTARQEVTRTQQQLRQAKEETEKLNDTAKRLRSDLISTEKSLAEASKEGELAQLAERVKELENANSTLTSDLEAERARKAASSSAVAGNRGNAVSSTSGAAPAIAYQVNTNPAVQAASIGTSTTIETISAANGLIVLQTTPELALTPGLELTLVKDLTALAKVRVTDIQGNLAIANLLPGAKTRELIPGTTVNLLR